MKTYPASESFVSESKIVSWTFDTEMGAVILMVVVNDAFDVNVRMASGFACTHMQYILKTLVLDLCATTLYTQIQIFTNINRYTILVLLNVCYSRLDFITTMKTSTHI
jgi:hypothetical protein